MEGGTLFNQVKKKLMELVLLWESRELSRLNMVMILTRLKRKDGFWIISLGEKSILENMKLAKKSDPSELDVE